MKKLMILFTGAALTLVSCKTQTDGLASAPADDVYYNPAKEHKPNVPPQPEQYAGQDPNQQYDPNAGKIGATAADANNPYYKDPNFNYDDYYDNAYAARIKRFNNPIYGTGYYDSYNTNSYFYNGNPGMYGTSIYNSYNMGYGNGGYGYYSPSSAFNNAYYNPYYNGFGNTMGYGSGMSIGYGMGSGMGYGYNPYSMCNMGYGYGGYNPYAYGMGYSPYGYGSGMGMGYSPYGYGMGYGMGYGSGYSSMGSYGGYYNSYDFNSSSYAHNGPRGSHSGGNSPIVSPTPGGHQMAINQPSVVQGAPGSAPYNMERFHQVSIPKENYTKIVETKNPMYNPTYAPANSQNGGGGRPIYTNGGNANGGNTNGGYNNGGYNQGNGTYSSQPRGSGQPQPAQNGETRPHKWFSTGGSTGDNGGYNNGGYNNGGNSGTTTPATGKWGGGFGGSSGGFGGSSSGGSSGGSGGSGGGVSRPHK